MPKLIKTGQQAKDAIRNGVNRVADVVKTTLGPAANTVALGREYGSPVVTDDGVTVAKDIVLEDPFENIGAALVREIAVKTNEVAGDGTTTATVLAQRMVQAASEILQLNSSHSADIKRGMEGAVKFVVSELQKTKKDISTPEEIENVAYISSLDAEAAKMISEIKAEIGKDGVATVEEGQGATLEKEVVKGLRFDKGYLSPYMITAPDKREAVLDKAHILLTDQKLNSFEQLVPLLEKLVAKGIHELLVICDTVAPETLAALVANKIRGTFSVFAVGAPGFGDRRKEMLQDMAALIGATYITEDKGLSISAVTPEMLGSARKVIIKEDKTTILDGKVNEVELSKRVALVNVQIKETKSEFDRVKFKERLGNLTGGIGVIKVGAPTETELNARKFKIEDALNATQAAIEEGIVSGGGVALYKIALQFDTYLASVTNPYENLGAQIIQESLTAPITQIAQNLGREVEEVLASVEADSTIIDPVKVTRLALENAASIAGVLVTTQAIVVEKPKDKDKENVS